GKLGGLRKVVRREEDRPALCAEAFHELPYGARRLWVERCGRLVQEHDGRLMEERSRDRELLPHAFRERTHRLVAAVPELKKMEIAFHLSIRTRGLEVVQTREIAQVLPSGETIVETGLLDRKSTRLNSSHVAISYADFCLKKKRNNTDEQ